MDNIRPQRTANTWRLNKAHLQALLAHVSKDPHRTESLRAVHFAENGDIVATDGHRLIRAQAECTEDSVRTVTLQAESLRPVLRAMDAKSVVEISVPSTSQPVPATITGHAKSSDITFSLSEVPDTSKYPPYETVIKTPKTDTPTGLRSANPEYMAEAMTALARILKAAKCSPGNVVIATWGDLDPIHIETKCGSWLALVMPWRI